MTIRRLLAGLVGGAAFLAGCGGADPSASPDRVYTVAEALRADVKEPIRVFGTLIANERGVRLCTSILESYPPQCGDPSLVVRGLDLVGVSNMEQAHGVGWTNRAVTLTGTVRGGVLRVVQ